MPHTWYLAVDMHLFILSPIFVYLLWRWKRLGLVSVVGFTLASLAATFTLYAVFDFPPTMMITRMKDFSKSSCFLMSASTESSESPKSSLDKKASCFAIQVSACSVSL